MHDATPARRRTAQPAKTLTAPAGGWITAKLEGDGAGDWDLAIFETETGRRVAGSASLRRRRGRAGHRRHRRAARPSRPAAAPATRAPRA